MIICKDFDENKTINSIIDWKSKCPPEGGDIQWKDGRSAMELAKEWTKSNGKHLQEILDSNCEFKGITFKLASPEYESKFDQYKGKGRQHDLLVLAKDNKGEVLISIEAKVDESFGEIIKDYYLNKVTDRINDIPTNAPERVEGLLHNVFCRDVDSEAFNLRYQLLYAVAGTVAEAARRRNIKRAILVIYTFRSKDFNNDKHQRNMNDLDKFINYLSNDRISTVNNDELIGPFNTRDNEYLSSDIDLYIIKTEI